MSVFSKIRAGEAPGFIIYERDSVTAILDLHPINPGHVLVFPHEEVDYLFELPKERYHQLMEVVRVLSGPLQQATSARRIGLAVEGFGVSHVHIHMVPVNAGNELNPENSSRATQEELAVMAKRIKDCIESH